MKNTEGKKRQEERKNEVVSGRNGEGEEKSEKVCVLFSKYVAQISDTCFGSQISVCIVQDTFLNTGICIKRNVSKVESSSVSFRFVYKEILLYFLYNACEIQNKHHLVRTHVVMKCIIPIKRPFYCNLRTLL